MIRPSTVEDERRSLGDQIFRGFYFVIAAIAVLLIGGVMMLAIGLFQGYRPVVLTSGSMTPTAPVGSIVIARPVDRVDVGDILVMPNEARATVTHRVVELETADNGQVFAITRGDANAEIDAAPYAIDGPQLIGRWVVPELGNALLWLGSPFIGLVVVGGAVLILTLSALSYIWGSGRDEDEAAQLSGANIVTAHGAGSGQKRFAVGIALSILFGFTGLAWSLYLSSNTVPDNAFSTSDCFDARVGSVQRGTTTSTADGITTETISAVEPTTSFVQWSVRSNSSKPGNSVVLADLSSATTIDFIRQTDTATPPPIVIEWTVVEYACGVTVQRGLVPGVGTSTQDIVVSSVDPAASFVIGGVVAEPITNAFDDNDQPVVELFGEDTVRFRLAPSTAHQPAQTLGYQLVTFDDGGDATTQVVSTVLGSGTSVETVTLPSPVNPTTTMLIATAASPNLGGAIGDRVVRVRLIDESTLEIQRGLTVGTVDVNVQVVELLEGSMVQHGVVTLIPSQTTEVVPIAPVDFTRSSVGSTSLAAGAASVGSTDEASSGEVGEALIAARLIDSTNLTIERTAADSTSSFAWQVVTWGGPGWGDPSSPYRQRVDVDAASVDVPTGYTTPVTIDHNALVTSGLSAGTGDDLRLWRFDGIGWTELDRVLDENSSWNDAATTFWFRTQEPVSASTSVSYWLYFGDLAPPPPLNDPANVYLLTEGFEAGLGGFEDRTEGTSWYSADPWTRRIDLSIDSTNVAQTLTDAVVLVSLTDADLAANAQADGSDLVFTDGGATVLPHDIERWDPATGALSAWVRVPAVNDTINTSISLLYAAADAPAMADQRATWLGQGIAWTMAGSQTDPAPSLDDRGAFNLDGLALADASRVLAPHGYAARLDGTSDRLEAEPFSLPGAAFTVTTWFNPATITGDAVLVAQGDPTGAGVFELAIDNTTSPGSPTLRATLNVDGAPVSVDGGVIAAGTWHHAAMVWDQANLEVFVDGVSVGSIPAVGTLPVSRTLATVLGGDPSGARTLDGDLGHVGVRLDALSDAEIAFEAANLAAPSTVVVASAPIGGTFLTQGSWSYRRPLTATADLTDSDINDFVLLVQFTDNDLGANAQADGDDLVFTAADGVTRLDHYVESWDQSTGALTAWVRLPVLSSTVDTEIFLYSGNPVAVDQSDPAGVWGDDADLVLSAS